MKRVQIRIEEDLDAALAREARREGRSKAAIVRRLLREHLEPLPALEDDPVTRLVATADFEAPLFVRRHHELRRNARGRADRGADLRRDFSAAGFIELRC